jgi:hypothetical protein
MTDADLRARAETIWTVVFASDPEGRALLDSADDMTRKLMLACFINGFVAGATAHGAKREAE